MVDDPHIPSLAISMILDPPWAWATRVGDDRPLNNRDVIRVLGGEGFWPMGAKYHNILRLMPCGEVHPLSFGTRFFQQYIKLNMDSSGESSPSEGYGNP